MNKKKRNYQSTINKIVFVILGSILVAIALEIFLIPNKIIDGGIVGISIMSSYLTKLPLGIFTFILNAPFLVIGYKQIGKTFAVTTFFANILLSIGVTLLHPIPGLTQDILLASVFGGVIMGSGVGLIIKNGGSLDGTEIIAILLDKKTGFSIGEIVMFFNFFILSSAGLIFGWDKAMYSLITYFVAFKTIDIVVDGLDESKAVIIVSDQYKNITEAIRDRLGRSVITLQAKGENKTVSSDVIYAVVTRLEIAKLKSIVHGFDENALMTIGNIEVSGKRYQKKAIH